MKKLKFYVCQGCGNIITSDSIFMKRLYPEWDMQTRLPWLAHGKLVWYCTQVLSSVLKPCVSLSTDGIISCFSWNRNKGGHTAPFDLLCYFQFVPGPYGALLEHLYEYALPGHDAVPCRLAYGAVIMALLAYLGNLAYGIWA